MKIVYTDTNACLNQIDQEQFEKIRRYIKSGIESGATLETGGEAIGNKGYYIQPTIFTNVKVIISVTTFTVLPRMLLIMETTENTFAFIGRHVDCKG